MFNPIKINDKVYIGGLYGKEFNAINQKVGVIKKITYFDYNQVVNYVGEIILSKSIVPVNLRYVFNLNYDSIDPMLLSEDIIEELFMELDIKRCTLNINPEDGQHIAVCLTNYNKTQLLNFLTLN